MDKCSTCRYWNGIATDDRDGYTGDCHRYPPTPTVQKDRDGFEVVVSVHPEVNTDDCCGEWDQP